MYYHGLRFIVHMLYPTVYYILKIEDGAMNEKLNSFFDGVNYFLRFPNLLHDFEKQDQTCGKNKP